MKKKNTAETLEAEGWRGCIYNSATGNVVSTSAHYVLDKTAWVLNNRPERTRTTHQDIRRTIRIDILNEGANWIPPSRFEEYIERDMTEQEIEEAEARLKVMGVTVTREGRNE